MSNSSICAENPLGLLSIDHFLFTTNDISGDIAQLFIRQGFHKSAKHRSENASLYSQGQVRFVLEAPTQEASHSFQYLKNHGEGVCKVSFLVEDAKHALEQAISRGAELVRELYSEKGEDGECLRAEIKGFGDVHNEFVQRPMSEFRPEFKKIKNSHDLPLSQRVARVDHYTNNVPYGQMEKWVEFYQKIFGFVQTRYFDIKGAKTGLLSKVVQLKNGHIIIPINQPEVSCGKSQIQEFLDLHNGAGVQHIALTTANILETVAELRSRGMKFLDIPHTYYEDLPKRPFQVEEKVTDLEDLNLLADGDEKGYLLQIFTQTYIGPLFFEYIQRKNHYGFGEGNFQALFDSIERDQEQRGYL